MNTSNVSFDHKEESLLVPYPFKVVFSVASSVVMLVSVIGNILVIMTFLKTPNLRTSTNNYITSMALSDILFVACDLVLYASSRLYVLGGSLSSFQCKFGRYMANVSYSVSIESLVLITVDRFIATVFPIKVSIITKKIRMAGILLSWIIPMGILAPFLHFTNKALDTDGPFICTMGSKMLNVLYTVMGFVLLYIIPLAIIIILNTQIMKSLKRTSPVIEENSRRNSRRHQQNQRIMIVLITINVTFFTCWTLYYLSIIFLVFFENVLKRDSQEMLVIVCLYFPSLVSTAVNPVILFTAGTNYRQALKNCFRLAVVKCGSCFVRQEETGVENIELPELQ